MRIQVPDSIEALQNVAVNVTLLDNDFLGIQLLSGLNGIVLQVYDNSGGINQGIMYEQKTGILTGTNGMWISSQFAPGNLKPEPVGHYIIKGIFNGDDNFEPCVAFAKFEVVAIPANLNIIDISGDRFYRDDIITFTIQTDNPAATNQIIPFLVLVNDTLEITSYKTAGQQSITFNWRVPSNYKAGQINLTIMIDPSRSSFFGQVERIIDIIGRTYLNIETIRDYPDLYPDRHFVYENETFTITLRDEDGDLLPDSHLLFNDTAFDFNNIINVTYQSNAQVFTSWESDTFPSSGNLSDTLVPYPLLSSIESEIHSLLARYSGDRFHDAASSLLSLKVETRPIMLSISDFRHNES
nr:hypothetical protein [Candidatus Sigynarchaeota archaeon]